MFFIWQRQQGNLKFQFDVDRVLSCRGGKGVKDRTKELLAVDPNAKAIVPIGYSNDAVLANYAHNGFAGIIIKPYTMDELGDEL